MRRACRASAADNGDSETERQLMFDFSLVCPASFGSSFAASWFRFLFQMV